MVPKYNIKFLNSNPILRVVWIPVAADQGTARSDIDGLGQLTVKGSRLSRRFQHGHQQVKSQKSQTQKIPFRDLCITRSMPDPLFCLHASSVECTEGVKPLENLTQAM